MTELTSCCAFKMAEGSTYGAAHMSQGFLRPLHSVRLHADGKRSHNVTAELHGDSTALEKKHTI